jgi:RNA polymerase sigma-70 factor (ECF subfamily)
METPELRQFEDLVRQHQRDLINFHYRFVGNKAEAEDLAQETFLKAYLKFDTVKDQSKLKSWLMAIARNVVIDSYRKNKDKPLIIDSTLAEQLSAEATLTANDSLSDSSVKQELERCLEQLGREDRAIVKLLYYEGFSYQEIAELLHMNQNTLKSRLHRARQSLFRSIQANELLGDLVLEYRNGPQ